MALQKQLTEFWTKTKEQFTKLSSRERTIVAIAIAVVIPLSIDYMVIQPINEMFEEQSFLLETVNRHAGEIPQELASYSRLKGRRDRIEKLYQDTESEGLGGSALERLVKEKAGITMGYSLLPKQKGSFGTNYEQETFNVKFGTTNFERLIDFFKEIDQGNKGLLMTRLDMSKSPSADRLQVDMDVSIISRKK